MNKIQIPGVSEFGAITVSFFLLFSFLARILLPFGDEPDFSVVAEQLIFGAEDLPWWIPYSWCLPILQKLAITSNCTPLGGPMSLWTYIDPITCSESIEQILSRFLLTMLIASPLLFTLIFRKRFLLLTNSFQNKLMLHDWNRRLDALSLSLILPGMIYYLGVLSINQFTLLLSLFIFCFWGSWVIVGILAILIFFIDLGNSLVILLFLFFTWMFLKIEKLYGLKASLISMFLIINIAYWLLNGFAVLEYIQNISLITGKVTAMLSKKESLLIAEKYPVIFRPIITMMTMLFMTPSGVKSIIFYLIIVAGLTFSIRKVFKAYFNKNHSNKVLTDSSKFNNDIVIALSGLTTILVLTFIFPDYANAKYYIFLVPFFIKPILNVIAKKNILLVLISCSSVLYFNLILFRF